VFSSLYASRDTSFTASVFAVGAERLNVPVVLLQKMLGWFAKLPPATQSALLASLAPKTVVSNSSALG
jgi:hypothetical protein